MTALPLGFGVAFDPDTKQLDESTLYGGSPARVMRLSETGRRALAELRAGPIRTRSAGLLARRLTDAGLAHPRPAAFESADVEVIIPVKDRADGLADCLDALGPAHQVTVVDDASGDAHAIAAVCSAHGVTLVRRGENGGPGAARNTGLAHQTGEFVAFLDSDCVPPPDWISRLLPHFADPSVAAVAPRITGLVETTFAGRYAQACGSLDLGGRAARVVPMTRVAYVPTAALIVRRTAMLEVGNFDPELRVGEDVDLVWRLHEAGWRIRYDPSVEVPHREPPTMTELLARRFRYGTSAGPLARRHPASMAPLVLYPWPTLTVVAVLARRPILAVLSAGALMRTTRRALNRAGLPATGMWPAAVTSTHQTWLGLGRYGTQFAGPALTLLALNHKGRMAAASLVLGPALAAWIGRRTRLDPARFVLAHIAEDIAYGAGVWTGAWRARTTVPVRPKFVPNWSI
jgi:mycofactocin glycosyltransferase